VDVILVRHRRHLAVERVRGHSCWRRAHGSCQSRGSEPAEELGIDGVLRQQSIRAAVGERKNRLAAPSIANLDHARRDELQRFVPAHTCETSRAFGAVTHARILEPSVPVHAIAELPDLRADVTACRLVQRRSIDRDDPASFHGHGQAAGIRTVQRTRCVDGGFGALKFVVSPSHQWNLYGVG
jgi:hypothetical protein